MKCDVRTYACTAHAPAGHSACHDHKKLPAYLLGLGSTFAAFGRKGVPLLTTKHKSTANRFIPRAVYRCLSFAISVKFFLQCPILLVQKRKKTTVRPKLPIQTRSTEKKSKRSHKIYSFGRRDLSHEQFTQRDQA